ncbi:RidA family protein [Bradyrhizobium sp. HKCCYLS2038]|uniref:RidA family protein n=1 Tax=unclassified Bradyrhizobium TaxID=2631580 RepID=UPI003EBF03CE
MTRVHTATAPAAIGPYSQGYAIGGLLFVSGQLPIDPRTGTIDAREASEQALQCLLNIKAVAEAAGTSLNRTVKTTIMLTDMSTFSSVNEVYARFFIEPYPARVCYEVSALPKDAAVEIDAIVALS